MLKKTSSNTEEGIATTTNNMDILIRSVNEVELKLTIWSPNMGGDYVECDEGCFYSSPPVQDPRLEEHGQLIIHQEYVRTGRTSSYDSYILILKRRILWSKQPTATSPLWVVLDNIYNKDETVAYPYKLVAIYDQADDLKQIPPEIEGLETVKLMRHKN